MEYVTEITRIIDAASRGDRERVIAYAQQLITKLRKAGERTDADQVEAAIIGGSPGMSLQHFSTPLTPPLDSESKLPLADVRETCTDPFVVLDRRSEERVAEFIRQTRLSSKLAAAGVPTNPSLLLSGAPGTGKSLTAEHVSASLELPLVIGRVDTLVSSYLGSTAKNLRALFEFASKRKCVLFLDEIDAIAKLRDDTHELGELKRVVIALLQNIDSAKRNIVLVAATNHPHMLDSAVWRRFEFHIALPLPDQSCRQKLLETTLGTNELELPLEKVSLAMAGLSCADVKNIAQDLIRDKVLNDRQTLSGSYLLTRIAEYRLGTTVDPDSNDHLRKLAEIDSSLYSNTRIAEIIGASQSTVSRRLAKRKSHAE